MTLLALWLAAGAVAADAPTVPDDDVAARIRAAEALMASHENRAARALLELTLEGAEGADRARIEQLIDELPVDVAEWAPTARLGVWQAAMGVSLAPVLVNLRNRRTPGGAVFLTGLGGAAVGAASAFYVSRKSDFDAGDVNAIILAQQLGIAHGLIVGATIDQGTPWNPGRPAEKGAPLGSLLGGVVGTGLGYAASRYLDPDADKWAGAYHGVLWGVGLTLAGYGITYRYTSEAAADAPMRTIGLPLLLAADLGAVGGYVLADRLKLDRGAIYAADIGALAFMGATLGFIAATGEVVPWTPHAVAWSIGGAGIVGGVDGVLITRPLRVGRRGPARSLTAVPMLGTGSGPTGVLVTVQL